MPAFMAAMVVLNLVLNIPLSGYMGWRTLQRWEHRSSMQRYLDSSAFDRSGVHRVLRGSDSRLGFYMLLQAGGTLDGEFFPESQATHDFTPDSYAQLLCDRNIDTVVAFGTYDANRKTNEHALLRALVAVPVETVSVRVVAHDREYDVYRITRSCRRKD